MCQRLKWSSQHHPLAHWHSFQSIITQPPEPVHLFLFWQGSFNAGWCSNSQPPHSLIQLNWTWSSGSLPEGLQVDPCQSPVSNVEVISWGQGGPTIGGPPLASPLSPAHTSTQAASQDPPQCWGILVPIQQPVTETSLTPLRGASCNGSQKVQSESKA